MSAEPTSVIDKLRQSELYLSGRIFSIRGMAQEINAKPASVRSAVSYLLQKDEIQRIDHRIGNLVSFKKPERHWIWKARLNDAKGLQEALA